MELRRRAYEAGSALAAGEPYIPPANTAAAALAAAAAASATAPPSPNGRACSPGAARPATAAAALAGGAQRRSGGDEGSGSGFIRFQQSSLSLTEPRGPVVVAKPYHTEARTFFNLSLLPTSVANLQADSGHYYSPAGSGGGGGSRGFGAGLRDGMIRCGGQAGRW